MERCITIAGGGMAGLTLGILLRRRGAAVRVMEAGQYPRHRVCGEFISGRGCTVLERLGLAEVLKEKGAREARTIRFHSHDSPARAWTAPSAALAMARFDLDLALAEQFAAAGGELRTGERWTASFRTEGVVRGTGRRLARHGGWRWVGIKAHAHGLRTGMADLEMYFRRNGYAGIARLDPRKVNVCALIRSRGPVPHLDWEWPGLLEEMTGWRGVDWDEASFTAVAGFCFEGFSAEPGECSIGDALGMIPPLTGNGMSAALESAELAAGPLGEYALGKIGWDDALRQVRALSHSQFLERLRWGGIVQKLVFTRAGHGLLRGLVRRCEWLVPYLFARTR